jgi:uncharacterized protein (DUF58 family)
VLPPVAARTVGRLGLGCWYHRAGEPNAIAVYPDMVAAHRVVDAIRRGRLHDSGVRARGRLGLGTEFEYIRNYSPDDDIRRVNWRATARTGRPMSNEYRVDQDRDVIILIDCGRLMAAPLGELTRLDAAVDAATALALVADEVGDRCGVLAFDDAMRARVVPQRAGSWAVIEAILDLEPRPVEADYELAFRRVQAMKRSYVLVLTDIFEPAAARPLLDAVPVLAAKHPVAVASAADLDVAALLDTAPETAADVYRMVVGLDTVQARRTVAARLTAAGVSVIEAPQASLGAACAADYLRAKVRIRL